MIKYLIIIVVLALALLDTTGFVSIIANATSVALVLILIFIISCFMRINGASYFFLALLFLGICVGALSLKDQVLVEKAAVWSYLFILVGLSVSVFEYNSKNHTLHKKRNRQ